MKKKTGRIIHLVPSFHYDIEYLLTEGAYLEICFENLLEAHRLLSRYPEYTYRVEQVFLLERFFAEYPGLLDDFRCFAGEGRFEVAAGMYAMADVNMPSGESILRQLVIGREWCRRVLGIEPKVLDMGDCTGHPAQMPQMAGICGYDYYVFERAVDKMERQCEINWQGIDGTIIPSYWLAADGYGGWLVDGSDDQAKLTRLAERLEKNCLSEQQILAHGGDFQYPYEKGIAAIAAWNSRQKGVRFEYSTYGRGLDSVDFSRAPVETCEWNPDRQGCYSSRIRLKQNNRESEALLYTAEAISAAAAVQLGIPADQEGLSRAWKLALVNQFHDIIWGTICDAAYQHALERTGRVRMLCKNIIEDRLRPLVNRKNGERRVAVFNPLPWPRSSRVELPCEAEGNGVFIKGPEGETPVTCRQERFYFTASLPACGVALYTMKSQSSAAKPAASPEPGLVKTQRIRTAAGCGLKVTTPLYKVEFNPGGVIKSLRSRSDGMEYVAAGRPGFNVLCLQTDRGDLWQYYDGPLSDGGPCGPMQDLTHDPFPAGPTLTANGRRIYRDALTNRGNRAEFEIENILPGELTVVIRGAFKSGLASFREFSGGGLHITWTQRVTFRDKNPQVDFQLQTRHIRGEWYRLRAAFMTGIKDGAIIHEIPFGQFTRPEGEFAAQTYLAYYDQHKGLALLNRGLPGNNVTDGILMLSLMRSVNIAGRTESDQALEKGAEHCFDYAIIPFAGFNALENINLARAGAEFNCRPYVFDGFSSFRQDRYRQSPPFGEPAGKRKALDELLCVENPSVMCTTVYSAGDKIILRLYETQGKPAETAVRCGFRFGKATRTDALMNPAGGKIDVKNKTVVLNLRPFEIVTLCLEYIKNYTG